jgi:ATP-dependent DNA helicase RecG
MSAQKKQPPQWLAIFREIASNTLIHREYLNPFPAKLIIERGQVLTENRTVTGPSIRQIFHPIPRTLSLPVFFVKSDALTNLVPE